MMNRWCGRSQKLHDYEKKNSSIHNLYLIALQNNMNIQDCSNMLTNILKMSSLMLNNSLFCEIFLQRGCSLPLPLQDKAWLNTLFIQPRTDRNE